MIEARGLTKSFKGFKALDDVGFVARDGEVTGLIGPNGAGKTTSLRILYTVLKPDSGIALIDGLDTVRDRTAAQRQLGVLADNRGLYPRLTAREHIRYVAKLHGMDAAATDRRIAELVNLLSMEDIADRRAKGFSKGQTMKVSLARALVHRPRNILLDEPTNGLDIASSRAVRQLIGALRDDGHCVLLSSHIMPEVVAICDRLVVMSRGSVVASGTIAELQDQTGKENLEEAFLHIVGRGHDDDFLESGIADVG